MVVASRWSLRQDEQGRAVAILETNNNITDRKRREQEIESLNQELVQRSAELEAINKELEAFAYSVSHDPAGTPPPYGRLYGASAKENSLGYR